MKKSEAEFYDSLNKTDENDGFAIVGLCLAALSGFIAGIIAGYLFGTVF